MNKLLKTAMIVTAGATLAAHAETDITVSLTTSYAKVAESAGPITGLSLSGITAFNGTEQVEFVCVSNRPYAAAAADSAIGQLPAGNYVHQLSVFNCWDGTRTRSYRVQIAQPVGSTDIYAYCPCFTVSQPGVNLADYPDIRNLKDDTSKIAASYTASNGLDAQLTANPVTALKLTAVPYIESDGTSGIDTGYKMKPNSRLEVDFAVLDGVANSSRIFGADYNTTALKMAVGLYVSGDYLVFGVGNSSEGWKTIWKDTSGNFTTHDKGRHLAVFDFPRGIHRYETAGGETSLRTDPIAGTYADESTQTLSLFARRNGSNVYEGTAKARIYGVKFYESDVLVHDFIPCAHDGIAAFRDAVTGDFIYGEQSPLAFTAGGDFTNYESPYVATPAGNSAYYIDTGYQASSNTCVALDCALTGTWENGMSAWYLFYGYGTQPFAGFVSGAGFGAYTKDGDWSTTGVVPSENLCPGIRGTFVVDNYNRKSYALVAGITNGTVKTPAQSLERCPSTTISIKIASHFRGNGNFVPMKIYGCKIYEEGVLVRDFVPCAIGPAQDGSAIVGLRDTITGAFATYPAATSANRLSCGGDEFPAAAPYVETLRSASRYIDTGYSVTDNTKVALDYAPAEAKASGDTWYFFGGYGAKRFVALIQDAGFGFSNDTWNPLKLGMLAEGTNVFVRRTIILDNPAAKGVVMTAGVTNINRTVDSAAGKDYGSSKTLKLSTLGDANGHFASIRIYGCKIWEKENGEYVLKRDYVPAVENGVAGIRDILPDGEFKPGATTATSPITYGGVFTPTVTPVEASVSRGNPMTLTASAPGAASYRWLKNGTEIPGATGATLAATYGGVEVIDSYQAIAVYTVDDAIMKSSPSAPATVEGKASATVIVIK